MQIGALSHAAERQDTSSWENTLKEALELHQDQDTHFGLAPGSCARLDRLYTSVPCWMLLLLRVNAAVYMTPQAMHAAKL